MRIREALTSLVPKMELEALAREKGVVKRQRKVEPTALFWTLVLGFGAGKVRSIAGFRREYQRVTGQELAPSAFYDRFTGELVSFLREVLTRLNAKASEDCAQFEGTLSGFTDVLVTDATVVRLNDALSKTYPGARTNHSAAAAKIHVVTSVKGVGGMKVKLTDGRVHDRRALRMGPWVSDSLLLFDLAYYHHQLFDCIDRNGGFFVTRLKANADPLIVDTYQRCRGRSVDVVGRRLSEVAAQLQRATLDVEVQVSFKGRVYAGVRRTRQRNFRLIGVRHPETGEHLYYLTNVAPESLSAEELAQIYAGRWQVELLFRDLKSGFHLEELSSRNPHVVEALMWSSLITAMVSRHLHDIVQRRVRRRQQRVPESRWAMLMATIASVLLELVLLPARVARLIQPRLERLILHESPDPNRKRHLLIDRVERGIAWA